MTDKDKRIIFLLLVEALDLFALFCVTMAESILTPTFYFGCGLTAAIALIVISMVILETKDEKEVPE